MSYEKCEMIEKSLKIWKIPGKIHNWGTGASTNFLSTPKLEGKNTYRGD